MFDGVCALCYRPLMGMLRSSIFACSVALTASVLCAACGDDDEAEPNVEPELRHGLTPDEAAAVLVKIGESTITVGEFAERLADESPYLRARYNSPERRREFLENMIRFELLAQEAMRRNMHKSPSVQRTRRQLMIQQMMKELFDDQHQLSDITDEDIEKYFEEHQNEFSQPAQVRASHILIADETKARRVLAQVKAAESDPRAFRELAAEHNEDPQTAGSRYGDLRFFGRDGTRNRVPPREPQTGTNARVPEAVAAAAFQIAEVGRVSADLIQTEQGFHIVKLTARRAALRRTLDDSRRMIQNQLRVKKRQDAIDAFITELRQDAELEENLGVLDSVRVPTAGANDPHPNRPRHGAPPATPPTLPTAMNPTTSQMSAEPSSPMAPNP